MSADDLDTRARQAAAAVHRSVAAAELSTTAPEPAHRGPGRLVLATLVVVVVLGGALVLLRGGDGAEEGGIASSGAATPLAPTELPDGLELTGAFEGPIDRGPYEQPDLTVYAGPVGSNVSIVGNAIVDPNASAGSSEGPEVNVDGEVHGVTWVDEATGRTISLAARGVSAEQMRTIVDGTTTDDRGILTIDERALPPDVHRIGVVPLAVITPSVSAMATEDGAGGIGYADEGQSRVLEVGFAIPEPHWLDGAAATMDDARAVEVRGQPGVGGGVGSDLDGSSLAWVEADGTFVRLVGWNLELDELQAVAGSLEPLTEAEWQAMLDESEQRSGEDDGGSSSGTVVESPTTFEGVGEQLPSLLFEELEGDDDRVVLRMSHDPSSALEVSPAVIGELPHAWAGDGWLYGVVPANAIEVRFRGFPDGEYATTAFEHLSGESTSPLWAYAMQVPGGSTAYSITVRFEDGTEITRSWY